ncbi:MAG: HNH endonuclease signature motif containing protein [Thermodesulfobacteriota bacterium]|nr:HNH endonuclease signature motif containing protein [Thermodesulfobacteriota bacterium]
MAISDKTRKILWGRSGNRCAICKNELVIDATGQDDESVVAEECHIISAKQNGPRHDSSYPVEKLDSYDNLMLLCRTHHRMVDDQSESFTAGILRQMKSNHEVWVSQKLAENQKTQPVRIRRVKQNIPAFLSRLTTGKEVLDLVTNAMGYSFDHEELKSQEEVDLVGGFLQVVQDWGDLSADLESSDRVQTAYSLSESLKELEESGFFVFGGREVRLLEGGIQPEPSNWPIAILRVLRKDNQQIIKVNFDEITEKDAQQPSAGDSSPTGGGETPDLERQRPAGH